MRWKAKKWAGGSNEVRTQEAGWVEAAESIRFESPRPVERTNDLQVAAKKIREGEDSRRRRKTTENDRKQKGEWRRE